MDDRFRFRAWDIEEKKYREVIALGQDRSFLMGIGHVRNDTQIFEQCTGLKDKNGKLIHEGDIIGNDKYIHEIIWKDKETGFHTILKGMRPIVGGRIEQSWINEFGFEVIGNIHENKELLND